MVYYKELDNCCPFCGKEKILGSVLSDFMDLERWINLYANSTENGLKLLEIKLKMIEMGLIT